MKTRFFLSLLLTVSMLTTFNVHAATQLFSFDLPKEPERPRSYWLPPLASFVLPGLDQWWEDQTGSAALYTGSAFVGGALAYGSRDLSSVADQSITTRESTTRLFLLGNQIIMSAGSFSAYQSFRSAVKSRQARGDFEFLKAEETTDRLLMAPFEFHYLREPSTYIPLLGLLIGVAVEQSRDGSVFRNNGFNGEDAFYSGAFSYLAGTNEEALFRGFLMPALRESWKSDFWSNTATAVLFSAAHLGSDNTLPWPQLVGGWYLGYLTQQNDWSLAQSIFIHTWWDVIAFTSVYLQESRDPNYRGVVRLSLPTITF